MSPNYSQTETLFIISFKLQFVSKTLHEYILINN